MRKNNFFILILCLIFINTLANPNDIIAGQGYSLIPDYKMETTYDYIEMDGVEDKIKRYSYSLIPNGFNVGYTDDQNGEKTYDFKYYLGNYDTIMTFCGAFNIESSKTKESYYVGGTMYFESVMGFFTGVYFYKDSDFQWGWSYEQTISEGLSYIIEKRGGMRNRGYKVQMSANFFYESIELDTENNYNLSDTKYKNFVYILNY